MYQKSFMSILFHVNMYCFHYKTALVQGSSFSQEGALTTYTPQLHDQ